MAFADYETADLAVRVNDAVVQSVVNRCLTPLGSRAISKSYGTNIVNNFFRGTLLDDASIRSEVSSALSPDSDVYSVQSIVITRSPGEIVIMVSIFVLETARSLLIKMPLGSAS